MEVCEFYGNVYGKFKNQLFVFEFSWDNVRPIEYVAWDGNKFVVVDKFKKNLFDPYYGFGSREMKLLCNKLFNETEFEPRQVFTNPTDFWKWCGSKTVWFRDRNCLLAPGLNSSSVHSVDSWKKFVHASASRPRTLKQKTSTCFTRRNCGKRLVVK